MTQSMVPSVAMEMASIDERTQSASGAAASSGRGTTQGQALALSTYASTASEQTPMIHRHRPPSAMGFVPTALSGVTRRVSIISSEARFAPSLCR